MTAHAYGCAVKKPKADQETAQPTAARFKKPKAEQETAQPTAARFKNSQRYYTTKRLIRDLFVREGELREYLFTGECVTEVCEAERNWRGKSS